MSVYTRVTQQQLNQFLEQYSIGELLHFTGIQAGIENTNYAVSTTQGEFIFTIFESLTAKELPSFLQLLGHLWQNNFPAPKPQTSITGQLVKTIKGKPAALFNRLSGSSIENPSIEQCREVGEYLARLHIICRPYNFTKQNVKNLVSYQSVFDKIRIVLSKIDINLLKSELNYQSTYSVPALPQGIIHADLFRDNVLFDKDRLSGVLDFYNACNDYFLFDIAVTINDWCIKEGSVNQQKFKAFLSGYEKIRVLEGDERDHLPVFLRRAALRFWLSRLDHQHHSKAGDLILVKDPVTFRRILEFHRDKDCWVD